MSQTFRCSKCGTTLCIVNGKSFSFYGNATICSNFPPSHWNSNWLKCSDCNEWAKSGCKKYNHSFKEASNGNCPKKNNTEKCTQQTENQLCSLCDKICSSHKTAESATNDYIDGTVAIQSEEQIFSVEEDDESDNKSNNAA
eukprot:245992_1